MGAFGWGGVACRDFLAFMSELLQDPAVQGGYIPLLLGIVLALLIRLAGGRELGERWTVLAVCIAWLIAYWILEGVRWPAVASKQKIFYIVAVAFALGWILEVARPRHGWLIGASLAVPAVAIYWIAARTLASAETTSVLVTVVLSWAASVLVLWRLAANGRAEETPSEGLGDRSGLFAPSCLLVAALGAGVVYLNGAEIGLAQLNIALGAILGMYMLVNFVGFVATGRSFHFGVVGVIGAGMIWLACAYVAILFGSAVSRIAVAVLLGCFVLDPLARRLRVGRGRVGRIVQPFVYGAIVALPAVAAVAWSFVVAPPPSDY